MIKFYLVWGFLKTINFIKNIVGIFDNISNTLNLSKKNNYLTKNMSENSIFTNCVNI